jgi:hypothetical protein
VRGRGWLARRTLKVSGRRPGSLPASGSFVWGVGRGLVIAVLHTCTARPELVEGNVKRRLDMDRRHLYHLSRPR